MDAILEVPIGVVMDKLSLDPDTRAQLSGGKMGIGTPLSPIYDPMIAREAGDWERMTGLGKSSTSLCYMNGIHNEAMRWARQITSLIPQHTKSRFKQSESDSPSQSFPSACPVNRRTFRKWRGASA